jgi:hypothetical protein
MMIGIDFDLSKNSENFYIMRKLEPKIFASHANKVSPYTYKLSETQPESLIAENQFCTL